MNNKIDFTAEKMQDKDLKKLADDLNYVVQPEKLLIRLLKHIYWQNIEIQDSRKLKNKINQLDTRHRIMNARYDTIKKINERLIEIIEKRLEK